MPVTFLASQIKYAAVQYGTFLSDELLARIARHRLQGLVDRDDGTRGIDNNYPVLNGADYSFPISVQILLEHGHLNSTVTFRNRC